MGYSIRISLDVRVMGIGLYGSDLGLVVPEDPPHHHHIAFCWSNTRGRCRFEDYLQLMFRPKVYENHQTKSGHGMQQSSSPQPESHHSELSRGHVWRDILTPPALTQWMECCAYFCTTAISTQSTKTINTHTCSGDEGTTMTTSYHQFSIQYPYIKSTICQYQFKNYNSYFDFKWLVWAHKHNNFKTNAQIVSFLSSPSSQGFCSQLPHIRADVSSQLIARIRSQRCHMRPFWTIWVSVQLGSPRANPMSLFSLVSTPH